MRVFPDPQVARLVGKERLPEASVCSAARKVLAGTLRAGEADLGGRLFKKRVARPGGGKGGGYRMNVAYRTPRQERILFTYGFAKNAASTLTKDGNAALRKVAEQFFIAQDSAVTVLLASGKVIEVRCDDNERG